MKPEYKAVLDNEKRYTRAAKERFLKQVAKDANEQHMQVQTAMGNALERAKLAGDALRVAKKVHGHRRKWSQWRSDHFTGSRRSSQIYMQVSLHWENPAIQQLLASGERVSIEAFLAVVRGRLTCASRSNCHQSRVRSAFACWLKHLDEVESECMDLYFDQVRNAGYQKLRDIVCAVTELDYYGEHAQVRLAAKERRERMKKRYSF